MKIDYTFQVLSPDGRWLPHHRSFGSKNPGKNGENPTFPFLMTLLLCLPFNVFIAVRLVTVGPRVAAPTEGRTFQYILRDVTSSPRCKGTDQIMDFKVAASVIPLLRVVKIRNRLEQVGKVEGPAV
jgi:hypothetical protein